MDPGAYIWNVLDPDKSLSNHDDFVERFTLGFEFSCCEA